MAEPASRLATLFGARRDETLLFSVMLAVAVGNTGLQSVVPAVGRSLRIPDPFIALAFSLSALLWAVAAPFWAKRLGSHGARRMVIIGMAGFIVSLLCCGAALNAGIWGWLSSGIAFAGFILGRGIYGLFGSAAPPAAQAILVARTSRANRTKALTLLASAFGLGTIIGPALAPFFILPVLGLAGPLYVFAVLGGGVLLLVARFLIDAPSTHNEAVPAAEPAIGGEPDDVALSVNRIDDPVKSISYFEPRIRPWMVAGLVSGHAQAMTGQTMAFLIIDRLALPPAQAQPMIGLVLMSGAGAALLAQWGVIPRLDLNPRQLCIWGAALAALGCLGVVFAHALEGTAVAFAVASLGFGFLRPGFTAGASLAVTSAEQGAVAGRVTGVNGIVFVFGPGVGIMLYDLWHPLPYLACTFALAGLVAYGMRTMQAEL